MTPPTDPAREGLLPEPAVRTAVLRRALRVSWLYLVVSRGSNFVAVPIILHECGTDLYAAWVLAGTVVMSQGLVDFGVGAALVRFAAIAHTDGSQSAARVVLRRGLIFYVALSCIVGVPMVVFASDLVGLVPYLSGSAAVAATRLVVLAAVAFGLTNLVLVLDSVLRGLGGISLSYGIQAASWVLFVPVLVTCFWTGLSIEAAGIAWVATYGSASAGLAIAVARVVVRMPEHQTAAPSLRDMASVGGRWQVSSWADFATFQLPRILGGLALSSAALVSIDLALRFSAILVAPLFAAYPIVLPVATSAWAKGGRAELASLLRRWYWRGAAAITLVFAAVAPLALPAVAVWGSRELDVEGAVVTSAAFAGIVAHASTGLFSSALLATGELGPVVRYKTAQLVLAVPLLLVGAQISVVGLAVGLAVSLSLPALVFNRVARQRLEVEPDPSVRMNRIAIAAIVVGTAGYVVVGVGQAFLSSTAVVLVVTAVVTVLTLVITAKRIGVGTGSSANWSVPVT